jgi:hypothetical protein
MHKIPRKFRDIPEAKRLRDAQARFEAAVEREQVLSKASGQQVYLVSAYLQRAQRVGGGAGRIRCRYSLAEARSPDEGGTS